MSQPTLDEIPTKATDALPQSPAAVPPADAPRARLADIAITSAILLATFAVGLVGGYIGKLLNFPLPWLTGSLLLTAALGLAGVPVRSVWQARAAGQFVTGAAIGTSFTPAILLTLLALLPAIVVGAAISVLVGAAGALILMRLTQIDHKTAFLAAMPGGVIEMANVAVRVGADPLPIMVLQTMRVGLTVCIAPFLVTILAEHGTHQEVMQGATMSWLTVAALMAASFIGGLVLRLLNVPNCWFLGSIVTIAVIAAFGLVDGRVPDGILIVAQVIIGTSIGTQFRHEFLTRLLRLLLASFVIVPFTLVALGLLGAIYALVLALPLPTMVLSLAPAGIAEMALTGKVLGLDAAMITVFHMGRILIVLLGAAPACRLFERLASRWT